MTVNQNLIGFITDHKALKIIPFGVDKPEELIIQQEANPLFHDEKLKVFQQTAVIKSFSLIHVVKTSTDLIVCLFENDLINVYKVLEVNLFVLYKSINDFKHVKFVHWCHHANTGDLLIVNKLSQTFQLRIRIILINCEFGPYESDSEIIDVAWSNTDKEHTHQLIAFSTVNNEITVLNEECKFIFKL